MLRNELDQLRADQERRQEQIDSLQRRLDALLTGVGNAPTVDPAVQAELRGRGVSAAPAQPVQAIVLQIGSFRTERRSTRRAGAIQERPSADAAERLDGRSARGPRHDGRLVPCLCGSAGRQIVGRRPLRQAESRAAQAASLRRCPCSPIRWQMPLSWRRQSRTAIPASMFPVLRSRLRSKPTSVAAAWPRRSRRPPQHPRPERPQPRARPQRRARPQAARATKWSCARPVPRRRSRRSRSRSRVSSATASASKSAFRIRISIRRASI